MRIMKFEKLKKIKTTPSSQISVYIKTPLFPCLLSITSTPHIYINYVLTSLSLSKVDLKNECLKEYKELLFQTLVFGFS